MNMLKSYDEFVYRVQILDTKINHQLLKAERLRSLCDHATTIWHIDTKVQTSNGNKREKLLAELSDCKSKLEKLVEQRDQAEQDITAFFNSVLKLDAADIMILKYVYGKSISEIAEMKFYTYSGAANKISRSDAKAKAAYMNLYGKETDS